MNKIKKLRIEEELYFKLKSNELSLILKIEGFDLNRVNGPDYFIGETGIWFWQIEIPLEERELLYD